MGVNRFDSYGFTTKTCPHQPDIEICSSSSTKNALDGCRGLNVIVIQRNKFSNCQRKNVLGELRCANYNLGWCGSLEGNIVPLIVKRSLEGNIVPLIVKRSLEGNLVPLIVKPSPEGNIVPLIVKPRKFYWNRP